LVQGVAEIHAAQPGKNAVQWSVGRPRSSEWKARRKKKALRIWL
jgi:hypothetical protein